MRDFWKMFAVASALVFAILSVITAIVCFVSWSIPPWSFFRFVMSAPIAAGFVWALVVYIAEGE